MVVETAFVTDLWWPGEDGNKKNTSWSALPFGARYMTSAPEVVYDNDSHIDQMTQS